MLIAIDPSSTATGVALFSLTGVYHRCEVLRPDQQRAEPVERCHQIGRDLIDVLDEVDAEFGGVRIAVIEEPPTFQGFKSNPGVQHAAFGVIWHVCRMAKIQVIRSVHPATWTGNKPKEFRAIHIRRRFRIPAHVDSGNDATDATGLGDWWIERNRSVLARMQERQLTPANAGKE